MAEMKMHKKAIVRRPEWERPLGKPRHTQKDNITFISNK
jgi:hypothetical protein